MQPAVSSPLNKTAQKDAFFASLHRSELQQAKPQPQVKAPAPKVFANHRERVRFFNNIPTPIVDTTRVTKECSVYQMDEPEEAAVEGNSTMEPLIEAPPKKTWGRWASSFIFTQEVKVNGRKVFDHTKDAVETNRASMGGKLTSRYDVPNQQWFRKTEDGQFVPQNSGGHIKKGDHAPPPPTNGYQHKASQKEHESRSRKIMVQPDPRFSGTYNQMCAEKRDKSSAQHNSVDATGYS